MELTDRVWQSREPSPQFYPDATTLAPSVAASEVVSGMALEPGCSVKDSFADLDLTDDGFDVLFEARWIHRRALLHTGEPSGVHPQIIDTPADLMEWQNRWSGGEAPDVFRPALLDDPAVRVLSVVDGNTPIGGAVLNHAAGTIGVSNVFAADDAAAATTGTSKNRIGRVWMATVEAAAIWLPGCDLVGYEGDDDLPPALAAGFSELGPLRVWLRNSGSSEPE